MSEEKEIPIPNGLVKALFTLLMAAGVILYLTWTVVMIIKAQEYFDLGLYAICSVMILMGLTGRLLYGYKMKAEKAEGQ